jgi:hypothetical protein
MINDTSVEAANWTYLNHGVALNVHDGEVKSVEIDRDDIRLMKHVDKVVE